MATLKNLVETDEGSHYLGEVALVPHDSPISQSGHIFFNTLFDENASCHLAIGKAYPTCLEGGADMSNEELEGKGVNNSLTHVDFMSGSDRLDIDGETADGEKEPIFRNGNWAF
jgi:aminopeptidase